MDEQAYTRLLNAVARAVAQHSRGAMQTLIALLQSGTIPRKAIRAALQQFDGEYYATLADAFSRVLGTDFGVQKVRQLPVSGLALSTHLYGMQRNLNAEVQGIIQRHAQGMHDARQLALAIYEGYGFRQREPLNLSPSNPELPKYLREALRDDTGMKADLLRLIARGQASQLRTPALRAAYLQAIDGFEQDSGGRLLEKRMDIAFQERMRYFANRIAQTELHRAYSDQKAREFMGDEGLTVLQLRMSSTHPLTDICDLHARVDKFGLGPGCYPKALAPKPGFHPFCRCVLVPRWDLSESQARERQGAERQFLTTLGERDGAKIMGSRARWLQATKGGESVEALLNAGKDPAYRLTLVGDNIGGVKSAYGIAKGGGKNHGLYLTHQNLSIEEINRSIRSFERQIQKHLSWIDSPASKTELFYSFDVRRQKALIDGWHQDIARHRDSIAIMNGILQEKTNG